LSSTCAGERAGGAAGQGEGRIGKRRPGRGHSPWIGARARARGAACRTLTLRPPAAAVFMPEMPCCVSGRASTCTCRLVAVPGGPWPMAVPSRLKAVPGGGCASSAAPPGRMLAPCLPADVPGGAMMPAQDGAAGGGGCAAGAEQLGRPGAGAVTAARPRCGQPRPQEPQQRAPPLRLAVAGRSGGAMGEPVGALGTPEDDSATDALLPVYSMPPISEQSYRGAGRRGSTASMLAGDSRARAYGLRHQVCI
jgi:hypothetical protein